MSNNYIKFIISHSISKIMSDAKNNSINNKIEINRKIIVLLSDIIKKFKTNQALIAFCKEKQ